MLFTVARLPSLCLLAIQDRQYRRRMIDSVELRGHDRARATVNGGNGNWKLETEIGNGNGNRKMEMVVTTKCHSNMRILDTDPAPTTLLQARVMFVAWDCAASWCTILINTEPTIVV